MHSVISAQSYVVTDDIMQHPLYQDWSVKTIADIITAKSDLTSALGGIVPTDSNQNIFAYLYNLLLIANTVGA